MWHHERGFNKKSSIFFPKDNYLNQKKWERQTKMGEGL
jgi:hypothetical protein